MLGFLPLLGAALGIGLKKKDDPLEEQKKFQLQQEWKSAKAAMAKAEQDTKNGIAAGITDSANKSITSLMQGAKAISF